MRHAKDIRLAAAAAGEAAAVAATDETLPVGEPFMLADGDGVTNAAATVTRSSLSSPPSAFA